MWIFCGGMKRSGSTLQFQITAELVEQARLGKRVEWVIPDRFHEIKAKYKNYSGWKVFKTHGCTDAMVREFENQNAIGMYIFRDLRDMMVSTMDKSTSSFRSLWSSGYLNECLENHRKWSGLPRMLASKYEEATQDLATEVKRLANHIGICLEQEKIEDIAFRISACYDIDPKSFFYAFFI